MPLLFDLYNQYNPARRRYQKAEYSLEKARAQAALDQTNREIGFRQLEDPREQAEMRQSLAARGLGKSSIADQNKGRLTDMQARRMAALGDQRNLQERGLSLIRKQRRLNRRQQWFDIAGSFIKTGEQAGQMAMGGGAGGGG